MLRVLVASSEPNCGKTFLIAAVGQLVRRSGRPLAYLRVGESGTPDATFLRDVLRLREPVELLVVETEGTGPNPLAPFPPREGGTTVGPSSPFPGREGGEGVRSGPLSFFEIGSNARTWPLSRSLAETADRAILIARYHSDTLDQTVLEAARLWDLGKPQVIINAVPEKGLRYVRQRVGPALAAAGLPLVGVIPQDRALLGMSVGDLARALNADVLCAADNLDQPVEAVMIAAMADEGAESYFRRVARKAVVAGGDRPDVHLPALATDTSCIVLTEGKDPDPTVLETAADQGVPLLKVGPSTLETLDHISDALRRARFRQRFKLARAVALVQEHVSSELLDGLVRTGDGPAAVGEAR